MSVKPLQVVVGVVCNQNDECLVALRQQHQSFAGYWEFPGGKIEADESAIDALKRELMEEVALEVISASPIKTFVHDYTERSIELLVYNVEKYRGEPVGSEGQVINWCKRSELHRLDFPEANQAIISMMQKNI